MNCETVGELLHGNIGLLRCVVQPHWLEFHPEHVQAHQDMRTVVLDTLGQESAGHQERMLILAVWIDLPEH